MIAGAKRGRFWQEMRAMRKRRGRGRRRRRKQRRRGAWENARRRRKDAGSGGDPEEDGPKATRSRDSSSYGRSGEAREEMTRRWRSHRRSVARTTEDGLGKD